MKKIIIPPNLFSLIKNKHLLLDTSFFIDCSLNPVMFTDFINELKNNHVGLTTIDLVKIEFLKGAFDTKKYNEKVNLIENIIDNLLPITSEITNNVFSLIKQYGIDSKALSDTDLYLGACLLKYHHNLFLLTKNTTDFPQSIFQLNVVINVTYNKGVHCYGLYHSI